MRKIRADSAHTSLPREKLPQHPLPHARISVPVPVKGRPDDAGDSLYMLAIYARTLLPAACIIRPAFPVLRPVNGLPAYGKFAGCRGCFLC